MADIADLAIRARTQGVQKSEKEVQGLSKTSSAASRAVRALGAAVATIGAGAAARSIRNTVRQTAQISELADVAGVSAERIQELSKSFSDLAGITESTTTGALRRFNRRLGLAEQGTGAAGDTFNQLGIAIQGANGEMRDTEPVLNEAISRLADIENESLRAARASELFGEDAGPQMAAALAQGEQALARHIAGLHEQGRVLENETVEQARSANDELNIMTDILQTRLSRAVADNSEAILELADGIINLANAATNAAESVGDLIDAMDESGVISFAEAIGSSIPLVQQFRSLFQDDGGPGGLIGDLPEMEQRLARMNQTLSDAKDIPAFESLRRQAAQLSTQIEITRSNQFALNLGLEATEEDASGAGSAMSEAAMEARTLGQEFSALDDTLDESLFRIASDGVEQIRDQVNPGRAELREYREQLELLDLAVENNIISSEQASDLQRQLNDQLSEQATDVRTLTGEYNALQDAVDRARDKQEEFSESGAEKVSTAVQTMSMGFAELGVEIANSFDGLSESSQAAIGAVGAAMGNVQKIMKEGGEESFETYKRLAQAEAAIAGALAVQKALASAPPPANIALAGTIGALTAVQVAAIEQQEYSGRKTGGQVRAGESYVVGENGPEIVTMNGGGHVTPNHQINSGNSSNVTQVFQLSDNARREAKQQILESAPMIRNMAKQAVIEAAQNGGTMSRTVGRRS